MRLYCPGRHRYNSRLANTAFSVTHRITHPWSKSISYSIKSRICASAASRLGGIFDYDRKAERLTEVERELAEPNIWDNPEQAQALNRERAALENIVTTLSKLHHGIAMPKSCWKWRVMKRMKAC